MAEALIGGLLNKKTSSKEKIFSSDPSSERCKFMNSKYGITCLNSNI